MIRIWEYGADPQLANTSITNIQIVEGNPVTTTEQFFDENGSPLEPLSGYPIAAIYDGTDLVVQSIAYYKSQSPNGDWYADFTIPEGFDFNGSEKVLTLVWLCKTPDSIYKTSLLITVIPRESLDDLEETEIITLAPATELKAIVPYIVNLKAGDSANFTIYDGNTSLLSSIATVSTMQGNGSVLTLPINGNNLPARLQPYNLVISLNISSANRQVFTSVRLINPSLLSAMQSLEMAINKANQVETINGLRFKESDLLEGLARGLDYFNTIMPNLTSFTGTNMKGVIREGWLVCSAIRVLRAQLQAEGWFNFDFSGQNVSLNVDRTAVVESACSYYEGLIDTMVRPLKTLLGKKGVISGDGGIGDRLATISNMGVTRISNTPLTRSRIGNSLY